MNIEEILDMLDELLDRAWNLPLSGGRCVIDAEKVREMVDDIRLNLPDEIKQAKAIVKDRTEILSSAKSEAEAIVRKAEERARVMIAQDEVMKQAQAKATEIVTQAQTKSKEIRAGFPGIFGRGTAQGRGKPGWLAGRSASDPAGTQGRSASVCPAEQFPFPAGLITPKYHESCQSCWQLFFAAWLGSSGGVQACIAPEAGEFSTYRAPIP